jgi:endonuclease/exonuclease/phosphatase family metal-dependent hydrolase
MRSSHATLGVSERPLGTRLATERRMRVIQLNLWARSAPYEARAALLRDEIGALAPDVISLQEVDGIDDERNQAAELFGQLGYQVRFDPHPGRKDFEWGMAIASRQPLGPLEVTELPHGGVAIASRVSLDDGELWFCSACPLGWWQTQEVQREDGCLALDAWLTELAAGDQLPPVMAGDFDATPDAASIRFLTGLQSLNGRSTHWVDAFAVAGDGSPGSTWSSDNPFMGPKALPTWAEPEHHRRIDYVFVGSPFKWPGRIVVRSAAVVLKEQGEVAPSDHYGVMADLDIHDTIAP